MPSNINFFSVICTVSIIQPLAPMQPLPKFDGQFILGISETFPISSFAFVVLGIISDTIIITSENKNSKVESR